MSSIYTFLNLHHINNLLKRIFRICKGSGTNKTDPMMKINSHLYEKSFRRHYLYFLIYPVASITVSEYFCQLPNMVRLQLFNPCSSDSII